MVEAIRDQAQTYALMIHEKIKHLPIIQISTLYDHSHKETEAIIKSELEKADQTIQERLECEFFGFGPLQTLIEDSDITEIVINGPKHIWFEKNGSFEICHDFFYTDVTFENFVQRICRLINGQISLDKPFLCQSYRNLRIQISGPAVTRNSYLITIRKHRTYKWTLELLQKLEWCDSNGIQILKEIIKSKSNILFVGPTGCGKTSVMSAVLNELNSNERVTILEDTDELSVPNTCSCKMLTREDPQNQLSTIDLQALLKATLRMRPDRIVLGEIRGNEAKDLLMALSTGHAGSMGSLHALSAQEALLRLEMLIQLGAPDWNLQSIRRLIFLGIKHIVVVGFNENKKRSLKGIYKIAGLENFGLTLDLVI